MHGERSIRFWTWADQRDEPPTLASFLERAITASENARRPLTVARAVKLRLEPARQRGLSTRHLCDLESRFERSSEEFGTCRLATIRNAALVVEEGGNSASVVRTDDATIASPAVAADYWAVVPSNPPAKAAGGAFE